MLMSLTRALKLRPKVTNSRKVINPIRVVTSDRDTSPVRVVISVRDTSSVRVVTSVKAVTSLVRVVISPDRADTSSVIPNLKPLAIRKQAVRIR